jgi:hypothetical protein
MKIYRLFSIAFCFLLASCNVSVSTEAPKPLPPATAGTQAQSEEAFEVARAIAKKLDAGQFDQIWDDSSQLMKSTTPKFAFTSLMVVTRKRLGAPAPRGAPRIGFTNRIDPNAPKGEYSVIQVNTTFGDKIVTEKFILAREAKIWKLAGYFMNTGNKSGK